MSHYAEVGALIASSKAEIEILNAQINALQNHTNRLSTEISKIQDDTHETSRLRESAVRSVPGMSELFVQLKQNDNAIDDLIVELYKFKKRNRRHLITQFNAGNSEVHRMLKANDSFFSKLKDRLKIQTELLGEINENVQRNHLFINLRALAAACFQYASEIIDGTGHSTAASSPSVSAASRTTYSIGKDSVFSSVASSVDYGKERNHQLLELFNAIRTSATKKVGDAVGNALMKLFGPDEEYEITESMISKQTKEALPPPPPVDLVAKLTDETRQRLTAADDALDAFIARVEQMNRAERKSRSRTQKKRMSRSRSSSRGSNSSSSSSPSSSSDSSRSSSKSSSRGSKGKTKRARRTRSSQPASSSSSPFLPLPPLPPPLNHP